MEPFRHHVYICTQEKPEGLPSCTVNGCQAVLEALRRELGAAGLDDEVQVTTCGSLGLCTRGPNMVVYPEGVWYSGVKVEDVAEIVGQHLSGGRPVARLQNTDPEALKSEILEAKRKYLAWLAAQRSAK